MLLEAKTNKYCPGGYDIGAISNLITWVLNFFLSVCKKNKQGICNTLCLYYYSLLRMFSRIAAAHERIHRNEDDNGTVRSG
jgi:hypothetical protein